MATRLGMIRPKKGITPTLTITTLVIIETIIKPKNKDCIIRNSKI